MAATQKLSNRVLVIFGARGDLARRMLFPGLFHLFREGLMPRDFRIIGSGRHAPESDDAFRHAIREALEEYGRGALGGWEEFGSKLSFVAASADDGSQLAQAVESAERDIDASGERLLYMAVPPGSMGAMAKMLGQAGIAAHASLVVEKPFGHDLASARDLNATLHEVLSEESIYRIDHFLGKEAVQNIMALRFANGIFEPIWNRDHVAYVHIDVPETIDIEGRGSFYEETGAFQDMVVTHLLQILGTVALEPPSRLETQPLALERTKVFESVRPIDPERVVFGQYRGYLAEEGVAHGSRVETFAAAEVWVDTWRWSGVPFYLRTGKAMAEGARTLTIGFIDAPLRMFGGRARGKRDRPSELVFDLSDDPQARIEVLAKVPGPSLHLGRSAFVLDLERSFERARGLPAYERLLHDVMLRDRLLFATAEQVERLWAICAPVIEKPPKPRLYAKGTWGPKAASELPPEPGWRRSAALA